MVCLPSGDLGDRSGTTIMLAVGLCCAVAVKQCLVRVSLGYAQGFGGVLIIFVSAVLFRLVEVMPGLLMMRRGGIVLCCQSLRHRGGCCPFHFRRGFW